MEPEEFASLVTCVGFPAYLILALEVASASSAFVTWTETKLELLADISAFKTSNFSKLHLPELLVFTFKCTAFHSKLMVDELLDVMMIFFP